VCIMEEVNKQSEFRNDISTECISRHILYEQYVKSLREKKVMVSDSAPEQITLGYDYNKSESESVN